MGIPLILGSSLGSGGGGVPGGEDNPTLVITDGTTTADFINGVLKLRYQGWDMQAPAPEGETKFQGYGASFKFSGYSPVTESFELIASSAATNLAIRQAVATIDKLLEQARRWHLQRGTYTAPVYLSNATTTETERRSLVYGGTLTMRSGSGAQPTLSNNNALATLTITRHPLWMDASETVLLVSDTLTCHGDRTAALVQTGTAPALINITMDRVAELSAASLTKIWIGILPEAGVTRTDFTAQFPMKDATILITPVNPMANVVADADGIEGSVMQSLFTASGHSDMHEIVNIAISDVDADATHWPEWRGTYRILMRCKVGAATTVGLQAKWSGLTWDTAALITADEVVVTNTSYQWIDLGECTIPVQPRVIPTLQSDHVFHIFAERLSGANEVSLDYLVIMPAEHMIKIDEAFLAERVVSGGVAMPLSIKCDYDDLLYCYQYEALHGQLQCMPSISARDFYFPANTSGLLVVVAERETASDIEDTVSVAVNTTARWMHYRDT